MRIKLLNNGGYGGLDKVKFPVEVNGLDWLGKGYDVVSSDLLPFGADPEYWDDETEAYWNNCEVEVLP